MADDILSQKLKEIAKMKSKFPDTIILVRTDGTYEVYNGDAEMCSEILKIGIKYCAVDENCAVKLASFPFKSLDINLPKLVRAGLRVAILDGIFDKKSYSLSLKEIVTNDKNWSAGGS